MKESAGKGGPNRSLEDIFREGFEGAESQPSAKLWENLDRELENRELKQYRKQAFWYRSVAAACVLLLIAVGGFFWNKNTETLQPQAGTVATTETKVEPGQSLENQRIHKERQQLAEALANAAESGLGPVSEKEVQNTANLFSRKTRNANINAAKLQDNALASSQLAKANNSEIERAIVAKGEVTLQADEQDQKTKSLEQSGVIAQRQENNAYSGKTQALAGVDSVHLPPSATLLLRKQPEESQLAQASSEKTSAKEEEAAPSKWSMGLAYAPQYAHSPIKVGQAGSSQPLTVDMAAQPQLYQRYQEAVNEYNQNYSPAYSYRATVSASYHLSEKWQLSSGLLYAKNVSTTQHSYLINSNGSQFSGNLAVERIFLKGLTSASPTQGSSSYVSVSPSAPYATHYIYQQVGVPLRIGYKQALNKFFAHASGGVNINLLLKNSIVPESNPLEAMHFSASEEDSPFRAWQSFAVASVGVGYEVNQKLSFLVAPDFTYALSPFLKEDDRQENAFQVGISIESKWRIFK